MKKTKVKLSEARNRVGQTNWAILKETSETSETKTNKKIQPHQKTHD